MVISLSAIIAAASRCTEVGARLLLLLPDNLGLTCSLSNTPRLVQTTQVSNLLPQPNKETIVNDQPIRPIKIVNPQPEIGEILHLADCYNWADQTRAAASHSAPRTRVVAYTRFLRLPPPSRRSDAMKQSLAVTLFPRRALAADDCFFKHTASSRRLRWRTTHVCSETAA
ncbi:hypothetical protein M440DRAFT_133128 [Trichoderma longibrachiatum ATCC 18648]|uniref:Uncharacterized protein n=1 Tax=Trichoderma longibrachiatum ATCC 18648 TaxID=983965 RepID=A0A2T4BW55_TRILO|nr:hypothetical protein M440DRAFT_133128 [Trichoderma longibrachiatum ATCC 18648]